MLGGVNYHLKLCNVDSAFGRIAMLRSFLCAILFLGILLFAPTTPFAASGESFTVGKVRVTALQDMPGEMDISIFRGADEAVMKPLLPSGKAPAGVNVFLVQSDSGNMLVDTGYGTNAAERKSALPELLSLYGLSPESVDTVLLTHMHGDHIGGLVSDGKPFFPNAAVLVSKKELDFWTAPQTLADKPGLANNIRMVETMCKVYGDKVKAFGFEETVVPDITALAALGHTPGHTMFLLESEGEKMLFWGDLVHAAALQFAHPEICAIYDMYMPGAIQTRRAVFEKAAQENLRVAGAHLPFPAVGKVSKIEGGEYSLQLEKTSPAK